MAAAGKKAPAKKPAAGKTPASKTADDPALKAPTKPASKLTDDLVASVVILIRAGNTREIAAHANGISVPTFHRWMKRGQQKGRANASYRAFREAVLIADAECEAILAQHIERQAKGSWRAALAILERRYPHRWAAQKGTPHGDEDETEADEARDPEDAIRDDLAAARAKRTSRS